ncbi:MAG: hypothetical protein K1X44_08680 [Alphaproteobacteria bacterium]|nr:hypothetical protein [Alphaproteobacteria bacterium]
MTTDPNMKVINKYVSLTVKDADITAKLFTIGLRIADIKSLMEECVYTIDDMKKTWEETCESEINILAATLDKVSFSWDKIFRQYRNILTKEFKKLPEENKDKEKESDISRRTKKRSAVNN